MRNLIIPITGFLWVCTLTTCSALADGENIAYTLPRPDKYIDGSSSVGRAALYVDPANEEYRRILNTVGKYTIRQNLENEEKVLPYFDYVILGGAVIKRNGYKAAIEFSEELKALLRERKSLFQPLQRQGIKVLLGITGGKDGITFGTIAAESDQLYFARHCIDTCIFYGLQGLEWYDTDGASGIQSPYPEIGESFFSGENIEGETLIYIPDDELAESAVEKYWNDGAGNMMDLISRTLQAYIDTSTFQGDSNPEARWEFPIMVRETNYARYLPGMVPRYAFESSLNCLAYGVNDGPDFGDDDSGKSCLGWQRPRYYAPQRISLESVSPDISELQRYSERFLKESCGLIYYTNMQEHSAEQLETLSIISQAIFMADVEWTD